MSRDKDRARDILTLSMTNGWLGIEKYPGGDAYIEGTDIAVWQLVNYRRHGACDEDILNLFPHLSISNLRNAWAYANAHRLEIDIAIADREEI
ncbi:MAG: DUF433 domain-containing protein [Hormoscilla sp.]